MQRSRGKNIAGTFYKKLAEYCREMPLAFDKETIHNFRVEYKKMRAYFRLLHESGCRKKLKIPRRLKKLYTLTGALRDRQLQQLRISETGSTTACLLTAYKSLLAEEIAELKSGILKWLRRDPLKHYKKKIPASSGFKLPPFAFYLHIKCLQVIEILESRPLADERLHLIRKILKDLYYNLEIYRLRAQFPQGTWKEKVADYFNPLLEEMGNYQDRCTAISLLEAYWLKHLQSQDSEPAARLRDEWIIEKTKWKKHLVSRLQDDPVLATGDMNNIPLVLPAAL